QKAATGDRRRDEERAEAWDHSLMWIAVRHVAASGPVALLSLCVLLSASVLAERSQRIPVIGRLSTASLGPDSSVERALRAGLRDLGDVEGRDYNFEYRSAEGRPDRLPLLAVELARLPADVIVTGTEAATRAANQATKTTPIVAVLPEHDPVASGL